MKNMIIDRTASGLLIGISIFTIYMVYLLFWPFQTVDVKSPCAVVTPVVQAGERVYYEVTYTKYANRSCIITKQLVNDTIIYYPMQASNVISTLGNVSKVISEKIPDYASPGKYKLFVTANYHISPFRNITKRWETEEFEVVK